MQPHLTCSSAESSQLGCLVCSLFELYHQRGSSLRLLPTLCSLAEVYQFLINNNSSSSKKQADTTVKIRQVTQLASYWHIYLSPWPAACWMSPSQIFHRLTKQQVWQQSACDHLTTWRLVQGDQVIRCNHPSAVQPHAPLVMPQHTQKQQTETTRKTSRTTNITNDWWRNE